MKLSLERFASVTVTPNTTWVFAVLSDGDGNSTTVEIGSRQVAEAMKGMASVLDDEDLENESEVEALLGLTPGALRSDPTSATAVSGLRTAVAQLCAMRSEVSLADYLGARSN